VCKLLGLGSFSFNALDLNGIPIYHTNVILSITENLAIVCLECIDNMVERLMLKKSLEKGGLSVIEITFKQVEQFCGNVFEVRNNEDNSFLIASENAWNGFTEEQQQQIGQFHEALIISIPTIEKIGGGSARCMVAGVYF
jgi:hypothetical protein